MRHIIRIGGSPRAAATARVRGSAYGVAAPRRGRRPARARGSGRARAGGPGCRRPMGPRTGPPGAPARGIRDPRAGARPSPRARGPARPGPRPRGPGRSSFDGRPRHKGVDSDRATRARHNAYQKQSITRHRTLTTVPRHSRTAATATHAHVQCVHITAHESQPALGPGASRTPWASARLGAHVSLR